jgi:hypothetical protein
MAPCVDRARQRGSRPPRRRLRGCGELNQPITAWLAGWATCPRLGRPRRGRRPSPRPPLRGAHPGGRPAYLSRPERPVRARAGGDDATVAAWEIGRFVIVVPTHPIMLVPGVAGHDLDDLTLAAGLADVGALNDDSVTPIGVHGEPPFPRSALASSDTAPTAATEPHQAGRALRALATARGPSPGVGSRTVGLCGSDRTPVMARPALFLKPRLCATGHSASRLLQSLVSAPA